MNRNNYKGELSYFTAALLAFLRESHPEIKSDEEFITARSNEAADAYVSAVRDGKTHFEAMEIADNTLYRDLRFSKYDMIYEIVAEWFPEVTAERRTGFVLFVLSSCQSVFDLYEINDEFETSSGYVKLQIELTGFIESKIQEYGVQ